jgi:hypothetical protein
MVGIDQKVNKIWLIRESKGSSIYYLTGDPGFVKYIKSHRRHWGNLVWTRGLTEDRRYSYWAHLWLLKTYLVLLSEVGSGHWYLLTWGCREPREGDRLRTDIGNGQYAISPKHTFKDTWRFDFSGNHYAGSVIKSFRNRLRYIEGVIWDCRNFTGECPLDWPNIKFLIEPRHKLPKTPEGPYDRWRMPEEPKKYKAPVSWILKIWKKIRAA